jgi:putative nucleotidyltransferase with HDIG domain
MKELIELANKIKDKKLREKTIKMIQEPEMSNPEIVYPAAKFDEIPVWVGSHHDYKGGQAEHTASVANISLNLAEHFEKAYEAKINKDHLISGALLHDIGKVFLIKKSGNRWELTGLTLDHAALGAAILFAKGFPEEVIHIVAAHGGDQGQQGANPRTIEAMLVFYADIIDAAIETAIHGAPKLQFLLMPPEEGEEK